MTKIINLREPVRDTAGRFSLKTATQRLLTRLCSIINPRSVAYVRFLDLRNQLR